MAPDAIDQIDSLFEVRPAEFVKARNSLVKALKAAGQREAADRAAKLTRPTASVWATNQLARHDPKLVARLSEATRKLQAGLAHDKARYAAAIDTHRGLLQEARQRIEAVLHDGGLRDATATIAAAVQNLRSGLMDERVRPRIEGGRLEQDVSPDAAAGVFGLSPMVVGADDEEPPSAPAHRSVAKAAAGRDADHERRENERQRREDQRARAKARGEAERRVHLARKAADAATAVRAKREAVVASARRELESAEQALREAQAVEREAGAALAAANAQLERLPSGAA